MPDTKKQIGRPKIIKPCESCGKPLSGRERLAHKCEAVRGSSSDVCTKETINKPVCTKELKYEYDDDGSQGSI